MWDSIQDAVREKGPLRDKARVMEVCMGTAGSGSGVWSRRGAHHGFGLGAAVLVERMHARQRQCIGC
jgi:hypothetical protein